MASSAKTPNLALNQWDASDPVLREDFNADNLIIDRAMKYSGKIVYGRIHTCSDMSRSMDAIEFEFEPKLLWLWQSGTDSPWYTAVPMLAGSPTAICTRIGQSGEAVLNVQFFGNSVSWSPSSGDPDHNRSCMAGYLAIG